MIILATFVVDAHVNVEGLTASYNYAGVCMMAVERHTTQSLQPYLISSQGLACQGGRTVLHACSCWVVIMLQVIWVVLSSLPRMGWVAFVVPHCQCATPTSPTTKWVRVRYNPARCSVCTSLGLS